MNMDAITEFRVTVAANMIPTVDDQHSFAAIRSKTSKTAPVHASSNDKDVVGGLDRVRHED
jgi:hypothetical protein